MACQDARTASETNIALNSWSMWTNSYANHPNAKDWPPDPPDPPPINGYLCRKCHRVFVGQREVMEHEADCLNFSPGDSFLKYETRKSYDATDKIIVSSQPLPQIKPVETTASTAPVAGKSTSNDGTIMCEFCHRVCKGKRGLKLHQNKCTERVINKNSSEIAEAPNPITPSLDAPHDDKPIESNRDISNEVSTAYEEIVLWRKNIFDLPKGHVGKQFVAEMTRLIDSWNNKSAKREYALKALMIMPALLLQKTTAKAKTSQNKDTLRRRLQMWEQNKFSELLQESRTLASNELTS